MPESFRTRLARWGFNCFPAYRGTGGRIIYIASDWREVRVALSLNRRTRNYVGTIYGGSIYGVADPIYMIMLIKTLGPKYIVWDKAASVRFRRPGRSTLYGRFLLSDDELDLIRLRTATVPRLDRVYSVDLVDSAGVVHATIEKTIQIRQRNAG